MLDEKLLEFFVLISASTNPEIVTYLGSDWKINISFRVTVLFDNELKLLFCGDY